MNCSARRFLGLPVFTSDSTNTTSVGIVETVIIQPNSLSVEGLLVGPFGQKNEQIYIPRESIERVSDRDIQVTSVLFKKPNHSLRVFGLTAWTTVPRVLVGFVYDFYFSLENGIIDTFVIHQIIRTWDVPATAVIKITPKMVLIDNDTTIKLKMTPFMSDPTS
jgi:sporulation protein YlmC with PRC-barrel domain